MHEPYAEHRSLAVSFVVIFFLPCPSVHRRMICDGFPSGPFCFLICMGIPGWELWRERFSLFAFQLSNCLASTGSFWLESTWASQYGFLLGSLILEFDFVLLIIINGFHGSSNSKGTFDLSILLVYSRPSAFSFTSMRKQA
jgi:hypothetical protein